MGHCPVVERRTPLLSSLLLFLQSLFLHRVTIVPKLRPPGTRFAWSGWDWIVISFSHAGWVPFSGVATENPSVVRSISWGTQIG
jgi:hypothetical protein